MFWSFVRIVRDFKTSQFELCEGDCILVLWRVLVVVEGLKSGEVRGWGSGGDPFYYSGVAFCVCIVLQCPISSGAECFFFGLGGGLKVQLKGL